MENEHDALQAASEGSGRVPAANPAPAAKDQPASEPSGTQPSTSGLAVAGLVLGILAILGAFVPLLNIFTAPFAIIGLILAIIGYRGIVKGAHTGKGIAVAGIALGAVALVVTIGMYGCAGAIAGSSSDTASSSAASQAASSSAPAPAQTADYIGAWDVVRFTSNGQTYDETALKNGRDAGLDFFMNIEKDGTWLLCMGDESNTNTGTWEETADGNISISTSSGDTGLFAIDGDSAKLETIEFKKAGASRTPPAKKEQAPESASTSAQSAEPDEVSPDVKEALDSYEAVMDDYVAFMQKYQESGYSASMLGDYTSMMQKYNEFAGKIEAMDTENMSQADYAYYIEVTGRVSQKLLEVAK